MAHYEVASYLWAPFRHDERGEVGWENSGLVR